MSDCNFTSICIRYLLGMSPGDKFEISSSVEKLIILQSKHKYSLEFLQLSNINILSLVPLPET